MRALLIDLETAEKGARRLEADRDLYWIARWFEPRRPEAFEGVVARSPAEGRGLVYVRAVHLELPLGERWGQDSLGSLEKRAGIRIFRIKGEHGLRVLPDGDPVFATDSFVRFIGGVSVIHIPRRAAGIIRAAGIVHLPAAEYCLCAGARTGRSAGPKPLLFVERFW